jgi:hypothetical protein
VVPGSVPLGPARLNPIKIEPRKGLGSNAGPFPFQHRKPEVFGNSTAAREYLLGRGLTRREDHDRKHHGSAIDGRRQACREAGLINRSAHGLRKAATRAAERDATGSRTRLERKDQ